MTSMNRVMNGFFRGAYRPDFPRLVGICSIRTSTGLYFVQVAYIPSGAGDVSAEATELATLVASKYGS
jgi:hypothetical protein